jgi:hypothetical protein
MICAAVDSLPAKALSGRAKSMALPFLSRPRARSRLLRYTDALSKLRESISEARMTVEACLKVLDLLPKEDKCCYY